MRKRETRESVPKRTTSLSLSLRRDGKRQDEEIESRDVTSPLNSDSLKYQNRKRERERDYDNLYCKKK